MPIRIEQVLSQVLPASGSESLPVKRQRCGLDRVCFVGDATFVAVSLVFFVQVIRVIRSAKNYRFEFSSVCTTVASRVISNLCPPNV